MRRRLTLLLAAAALTAPVASAPAAPVHPSAQVTAAHSCSSGYRHAVIGGSHKCLRRGQFCSRPLRRQYRRYGFRCNNRDSRGNWHLT